MVNLRHVTKRFRAKTVVDDLSIEIQRGELFGLLGPNGAGKTTTINMIIGGLLPDAGTVTLQGSGSPRDADIKRLIGIVPQSLALYENLTAHENANFFGRLYGLHGSDLQHNIQRVFELVNLTDRTKDRVNTYSGGMKRRLNIAIALLHNPSLLILDEPTVGVDPQSRNAIFDSLRKLKAEGCTILLTSHYLEEAQQLCDAVAILDEGKLVAKGTVEELIAQHGGQSVLTVETTKGRSRIETDAPVDAIVRIHAEEQILSLKMESPNLEKAFLKITGKHLRD
ncbi:ABC transporter ATP-binding protein [Chryseolinea lacunae]|uniref:ABC transporter ATP-binding protein n=1 Tax=Chryseolinea lacunae TaxID=2801331 RepID=A0ABS1KP09_9BACT|nr:ABC transporter ATP-binding protein [Chryseolinea lacunae]MBL0739986.1 ABC transporter ATP-binding protein [Chryseolinea lacunae]